MSIIIDKREQKLIKWLESQEPPFPLKYETEQLNLGDIIIRGDNREIIIERKTIDDFFASVKDKRFDDQRQRLLDWKDEKEGRDVLFLFEGTLKNGQYGGWSNPTDVFKTAKISLMVKFRFLVQTVPDLEGTAKFLCKAVEKFQEDAKKTTNIFKKKSDCITSQNYYEYCLSLINGVSMSKAKKILGVVEYHNIREMDIGEFTKKMKNIGIGKTIAQRIREFIV
jgi:ERCC4-type nuclease